MAVSVILFAIAASLTIFIGYLTMLAAVYFIVPQQALLHVGPQKRFAILIPAHNEEQIIDTVLRSWESVDYPPDLFHIHVIADNCTDRTAEIGRKRIAHVWERQDSVNRGKGHALAWALATIDFTDADAIVISDADTGVDAQFLAVMNDRLMAGDKVVQGYDGVMNPYENAMTCLMEITNVMKNLLFNYAKSKIGLSVQLMGTGMCLDKDVLKQIGWQAFSIGEDGEQFAYMARAGMHVAFEPKAKVYAQEASSFQQAHTQRVRWSAGRMQLSRLGVSLLCDGLKAARISLLDAAMTFLLPNYAMLANITIAGLVAAGLYGSLPGRPILLWWYSGLLSALVAYFLVGLIMSRPPKKLLASLAFAPFFLMWKLFIDIISIFRLRQTTWVRTRRGSPDDSCSSE